MTSDPSQFVGDIPRHYDAHLGPVLFEPFARDLTVRAATLVPDGLLELAAGTGILTNLLQEQFPGLRIVATDLNAPMLEVAASKIPQGANVEFQPADAMNLPFEDRSFDTVLCQFGVMFFPDKVASYREVHRILTPGGTYLFNHWGTHAENPFARIGYQVGAEFFPDDPPGFYLVPFSYSDPEVAVKECREAGFSEVRSETVDMQPEVADWSDFAIGFLDGNPLIGDIVGRGRADVLDDVLDDMRAELARRFEAEFGPAPARMPLRAHVVRATA